jgi:hypothetical protein
VSQRALSRQLQTLFGLNVPAQSINEMKSQLVKEYTVTYEAILKRLTPDSPDELSVVGHPGLNFLVDQSVAGTELVEVQPYVG